MVYLRNILFLQQQIIFNHQFNFHEDSVDEKYIIEVKKRLLNVFKYLNNTFIQHQYPFIALL